MDKGTLTYISLGRDSSRWKCMCRMTHLPAYIATHRSKHKSRLADKGIGVVMSGPEIHYPT